MRFGSAVCAGLAFMLCIVNADAAEPTLPTADTGTKACSPLGVDTGAMKERMYSFQPTFGKDPMIWSEADYDWIVRLAAACNGVTGYGEPISSAAWTQALKEVKEKIYPVSVMNRSATGYASRIRSRLKFPDCRMLTDYAVDPNTLVDSSEKFFGVDAFAMSDEEIDVTVTYANICRAIIPEWLGVSKTMLVGDALAVVGGMMDRFLLVKTRRAEWKKMSGEGLILSFPNGSKIPPTMTSAPVRELVTAFDQWTNTGYYQSPNVMSRMLAIVDKAKKLQKGAFDQLYVDYVYKTIQERMLDQ